MKKLIPIILVIFLSLTFVSTSYAKVSGSWSIDSDDEWIENMWTRENILIHEGKVATGYTESCESGWSGEALTGTGTYWGTSTSWYTEGSASYRVGNGYDDGNLDARAWKEIDLANVDNLVLDFWARCRGSSTVYIKIGIGGDTVYSFTGTDTSKWWEEQENEYIVDVSGYSGRENLVIRAEGETDGWEGEYIYIDNVTTESSFNKGIYESWKKIYDNFHHFDKLTYSASPASGTIIEWKLRSYEGDGTLKKETDWISSTDGEITPDEFDTEIQGEGFSFNVRLYKGSDSSVDSVTLDSSNEAPVIENESPSGGIEVETFGPTLEGDIKDADGDTLDVTIYDNTENTPEVIETLTIEGGKHFEVVWPNLYSASDYDWYVKAVDEGGVETIGDLKEFTTYGSGFGGGRLIESLWDTSTSKWVEAFGPFFYLILTSILMVGAYVSTDSFGPPLIVGILCGIIFGSLVGSWATTVMTLALGIVGAVLLYYAYSSGGPYS